MNEWIDLMINEKGFQPTTVIIRVRTMRAFLRWYFLGKLIYEPIHEKVKLMKTAEDRIKGLTVADKANWVNTIFKALPTLVII
ncbi:hypothetical protein [Bacillus sp. 7884-1]|uniref:hypothetical protein n=1 Tax=Bacillus sp. 7884-1 TaxID=2021693 RepID=UPI000BA769F7|nr:hypothetical protein [Bacillus sp. 7884-1]PAE35432.1 hypothetical protein CHI06_23575 [Bacillus sp. 7884-1]